MPEASKYIQLGQLEVVIQRGDITTMAVDAVVNAANAALEGGSGVDGAMHAAAGPQLLEACQLLGRCSTGSAVITPGFRLPAKYVIHAVGPMWKDGTGGEAELLASCYQACFHLCEEHAIKSLAIPAISTGAYRFPKAQAAQIAITACREFKPSTDSLKQVYLVPFDARTERIYQRAMR